MYVYNGGDLSEISKESIFDKYIKTPSDEEFNFKKRKYLLLSSQSKDLVAK